MTAAGAANVIAVKEGARCAFAAMGCGSQEKNNKQNIARASYKRKQGDKVKVNGFFPPLL